MALTIFLNCINRVLLYFWEIKGLPIVQGGKILMEKDRLLLRAGAFNKKNQQKKRT